MGGPLYDTDFYGWTNQQSALLRSGNLAEADLDNLAEEIEDMGKNLRRELESRLKVLFIHLLKWQYQPGYRGNNWRYSIEEQRTELAGHLQATLASEPSCLKRWNAATNTPSRVPQKKPDSPKARFPISCPWSFEKAMEDEFFPE